jgi:hypothetical protein
MAGANMRESRVVEAEYLRHPLQITELALMHGAIGLGDIEQAIQDVLQHGPVVGQKPGHVARIDLEAGGVPFGEVVDAIDVPLLAGRNREDAAEGVDFGASDHAVGLGHLGGERDHGDGEGRLPAHLAVGEAGQRRPKA